MRTSMRLESEGVRGLPPPGVRFHETTHDERRPPRGPWFPKESAAKGAKVCCLALLPALVRARGDGSLLSRAHVRPPEVSHERLLVVQLCQEAVAAPPVYGVQGTEPTDQGAVEESGKRLWAGTPEGASAEMAMEGRRHWGSLDFLKSTRVGCRASAEAARSRVDEDRDRDEIPGQEGEEDGPGPP